MTLFDLQFVIPGILSILLGIFLFFWKGLDSMYADKENSEKSIKHSRYFWSAFTIVLGVLAILGVVFDWPVMGYLIPPPK